MEHKLAGAVSADTTEDRRPASDGRANLATPPRNTAKQDVDAEVGGNAEKQEKYQHDSDAGTRSHREKAKSKDNSKCWKEVACTD